MADALKTLYQGQLPSSVATLATVGGGKMWDVREIIVVNNDSSARTFSLYKGGTAAANIITPPNVSVPAGGMWVRDCRSSYAAADTIAGVASMASQLTITISGDEIS